MRTVARWLRRVADWIDCGCQPPHYLVLCKKHGQRVLRCAACNEDGHVITDHEWSIR